MGLKLGVGGKVWMRFGWVLGVNEYFVIYGAEDIRQTCNLCIAQHSTAQSIQLNPHNPSRMCIYISYKTFQIIRSLFLNLFFSSGSGFKERKKKKKKKKERKSVEERRNVNFHSLQDLINGNQWSDAR